MANVYPRRLHRDAVGVLRTQRALRQDMENGERIEEPKENNLGRVEAGQIVKRCMVLKTQTTSEKDMVV